MDVVLPRDGDVPLRVSGDALGFASSERTGRSRWIEIALFRSNSGRYVVAGVGRSTIPGEEDRRWAYVEDDASAVIKRLERHEAGDESTRYLTRTAAKALTQAAEHDEGIRKAFAVSVA
jgi:hypothetical protein